MSPRVARVRRASASTILILKTHLSRRDLALTLAVVAVWGYTFVPIKVALAEVPPFTLAALRFFLPRCRWSFSCGGRRCRGATSSRMASRSASVSSACCSSD
jgi:hypothetical protein